LTLWSKCFSIEYMSKRIDKKTELIIAIIFVLAGVGLRLIPHAPNFTPIGAIALFGGVYLSRRTALILPILALLISDAFIGSYSPKLMFFVYGSFLLCVILGFYLKKNKKWKIVLGGSILCSLIFFMVTNFAVWALTPWYTKTISGIIQCYLMALPFFRNTLLGNLFYTSIFFTSYELIRAGIKKKINICYFLKRIYYS